MWCLCTRTLTRVCVLYEFVFKCKHVFTDMHTCGGQKSMSGIFFSHSLPPFMSQGLSLNMGLTDATRLVVKQMPELPSPLISASHPQDYRHML